MSHWWSLEKFAIGWGILAGLLFANPVTAALSLQTSFNVTETYTDNVRFRNNDTEEDFGTLFGPNLTLLFEDPDIVIGATYSGRVALYVNNPGLNRYNQNANILLDLPFLTKRYRGLTVTIDETMNFVPVLDAFALSEAENARVANPNATGGGAAGGTTGSGAGGTTGSGIGAFGGTGGTQGVFTRRASAFANSAGLTLGYAWSPRLSPSLGYTNQYRHFFSNGFQDSLSHTGTFAVPYRVTEFTAVTSSYSYRQTDFLGKSTQATTGDRIISHAARLGLSHSFNPTLSATITGGVAFAKQRDATELVTLPGGATQERSIGGKFVARPLVSASIAKSFPRGTVSLSGNQTIGSGGGLASQATQTRTVTGQGSYALTPRMNAFASVGWAHNDSIEGNAFDADTYRFQTGLGYSFTRWLFGNLSYSRIDQRSKGTVATDVVVNQAFLSLTAVADPWFLVR